MWYKLHIIYLLRNKGSDWALTKYSTSWLGSGCLFGKWKYNWTKYSEYSKYSKWQHQAAARWGSNKSKQISFAAYSRAKRIIVSSNMAFLHAKDQTWILVLHMRKEIEHYVRTCEKCQKANALRKKPQGIFLCHAWPKIERFFDATQYNLLDNFSFYQYLCKSSHTQNPFIKSAKKFTKIMSLFTCSFHMYSKPLLFVKTCNMFSRGRIWKFNSMI